LRDVTDWVFDRAEFAEDCGDVGGISPAEAMLAWGPWVFECVEMLDGDGAFAHLPEPGAYREQPARDMMIYSVIRGQWVKRRNEEMGNK